MVLIGFAVLYLCAAGLLAIGTFGLFGQEEDPLSAVFLLPLGLPWILLSEVVPEGARPWFVVLAPMLNLFILWRICSRFSGRAR